MADGRNPNEMMLSRQPGSAGGPADMLVVVDPPLQAVRALSHGGRAHFKEQCRAVVVLLAQHNRDIACEVALEALPGAEPDVVGCGVESISSSVHA